MFSVPSLQNAIPSASVGLVHNKGGLFQEALLDWLHGNLRVMTLLSAASFLDQILQ